MQDLPGHWTTDRWRQAYERSDFAADIIYLMMAVLEFTAYATVIVWILFCDKNKVSLISEDHIVL